MLGALLSATHNLITVGGAAHSAAAWTTTGLRATFKGATYTDTSSSGTVTAVYVDAHKAPTLAASSATTYTNAYSVYAEAPVAGTNVTLTNAWALGADSLKVNGVATITGHVTLEGVTSTGATGTGNLVFATSPTFGGNISVGNANGFGDGTTVPYQFTASHQANITGANSANYSANLQNTASGTTQQIAQLQISAAAPNNGTAWFWQAVDNSATRGTFLSNGGLANFSANNTNLSDARVKPSFERYTDDQIDALSQAFCAVDWGRFKYDDQSHDDWNHGYTAQGVKAAFANVAPELVDTWVDGKLLAVYNEDLKNIGNALLARLIRDVAEIKKRMK